MSKPDNATIIDEAVIEGLRPQARRYDVAVDEHLVIAILPNGSKTWTWVNDGPGKPHRQTLGIYPDMSLAQAKDAQQAAAAAHERTGERDRPTEFVIRGGKIQRAHADWKLPLAGAFVVFVAGALFSWLLLSDSDSPADEGVSVAETATARRQDPAPAGTNPVNNAGSEPINTQALQPVAGPASATQPSAVDREADNADIAAAVGPAVEQARRAIAAAIDEPLKTLVNQTPASESAAHDGTHKLSSDDRVKNEVAIVNVQPERPNTAQAATSSRPGSGLNPGNAPDSAAPRQSDGNTVQSVTDDARVARAQLTSEIVDREPVDHLGAQVAGQGEAVKTVYFFTELRRLAGQQVRHRWIFNDQIVGDVAFNIGDAWRWRVYSSKRLLASQAGLWRIEVVLDDGTTISAYRFEFQP